MELKTVVPNPCEHCQYSYDKETCDRGNRCKEWYHYNEITKQRDADQKILNPIYDAYEVLREVQPIISKYGLTTLNIKVNRILTEVEEVK